MIDKSEKQTIAEIVASHTNKVAELSESIGELKAENRRLTVTVSDNEKTIMNLKVSVQSLKELQDELINAAAKLGINLTPILEQSGQNMAWAFRGLELAGAYLKPQITQLSIPDFNSAKNDHNLQQFVSQLPGAGLTEDERVASESYHFTRLTAKQFILGQ